MKAYESVLIYYKCHKCSAPLIIHTTSLKRNSKFGNYDEVSSVKLLLLCILKLARLFCNLNEETWPIAAQCA